MKRYTIVFILILFASSIYTQHTDKYKVTWKNDRYILAAGLGINAVDYWINNDVRVFSEEEIMAFDPQDILAIDRSAVDRYNLDSKLRSDYLLYGATVAPALLMLSSHGRDEFFDIGIMYTETILANYSITSMVKSLSGRKRPYVYNPEVPLEDKMKRTASRSFFSGHVSHVSSMCYFSASVMDDLHPDSNWRPVWWTIAAAAPAITGYYRYDAGRHFLTDVAVGYVVGGVIGYLIPKLHHRNKESKNISVQVIGSGIGITMNLQ